MSTTTRDAVRSILEHADQFSWSLQGFGMLRCYLGTDKATRLHVWDDRYTVPNVSVIHDHPWDFESMIISGRVRNIRYAEHLAGLTPTHHVQRIVCGQGGCALERLDNVRLTVRSDRTLVAGDEYTQHADELHESQPSRGAVTLIHRRFRADTERARVLFPVGTEWVSAEPRAATAQEVSDICGYALSVWS